MKAQSCDKRDDQGRGKEFRTMESKEIMEEARYSNCKVYRQRVRSKDGVKMGLLSRMEETMESLK